MNIECARRVRSWMVLRGLTLRAVALELGISHQAVSAWLRGDVVSRRIADHLKTKGCPKNYFRGTKYEETRVA